MNIVTIETKRCTHCGELGELQVSSDGLSLRNAGALMQDAFPELSAPLREQLISGTHPACWERMFSIGDDEDEFEE
jgi:hypothetical protein